MAFRAWINSLLDSYACVPVWHLEHGLIVCWIAMLVALCGIFRARWAVSWLTLIEEGLCLDRYAMKVMAPKQDLEIVKVTEVILVQL